MPKSLLTALSLLLFLLASSDLFASDSFFDKHCAYDLNGNITEIISPMGEATHYEYNALNQLTRVIYPDASSVEYRYDLSGNRIETTNNSEKTNYSYDCFNRLIQLGHPGIKPIEYSYDKVDRLIKIIYPTGESVDYSYDLDGRITTVSDAYGTTAFEYDNFFNTLTKKTLPNGVTTEYTYDSSQRITSVSNRRSDQSIISAYLYTFDANDNCIRASITDLYGMQSITYAYDRLNRLIKAERSNGTFERYTYDSFGNRLLRETEKGKTFYEYDENHRLKKAGNITYSYDNSGNLIKKSTGRLTSHYEYDFNNRLIEYRSGNNVVLFAYDSDGNRVSKTVNGKTTKYINDLSSPITKVLVEVDENNNILARYTYAGSQINQATPNTLSYYLFDNPNKNITALVDHEENICGVYQYDTFGSLTKSIQFRRNDFGYNGEQFDAETGLIFLRNRYYDPEIGRFISQDPFPGWVSEPQSENPYSYVHNNPVNMVDPLGFAGERYFYTVFINNPGDHNGDKFLVGHAFEGLFATGHPPHIRGKYPSRPGHPAGHTLRIDTPSPKTIHKTFEITEHQYFTIKGSPPGEYSIFSSNCADYVMDHLKVIGVDVPGYTRTPVLGIITTVPSMVAQGIQSLPDTGLDYRNLPFEPANLGYGGVSLSKTAHLMAHLCDISGAAFDHNTGQIILYGKQKLTLPPMDFEDLSVAVRSIYGLNGRPPQDPGVSIGTEHSDRPGWMTVRYDGQTHSTAFGKIMFEADRLLKVLEMGKDNLTGKPFSSGVPGYKSLPQRYCDVGGSEFSSFDHRMWFLPGEISLSQSRDNTSMVFNSVTMKLLTENTLRGQGMSFPVANDFANHFTENYDAFAKEFPCLEELKRLGKITAVVKWIKENNIPFDASLFNYGELRHHETPDYTPEMVIQKGWMHPRTGIGAFTMTGGISYLLDEGNYHQIQDERADLVQGCVMSARSSEIAFSWPFYQGAEKFLATAHSLVRTKKDGAVVRTTIDMSMPVEGQGYLNFTRVYSSFNDATSGFGRGWEFIPHKLRFPGAKGGFTLHNGSIVYAHHQVFVTIDFKECQYTFRGVDETGMPIYQRDGMQAYLKGCPHGGFILYRRNRGEAYFDEDGRLNEIIDDRGSATHFDYAEDRLSAIRHQDGHEIVLHYCGNRIDKIEGSGERAVYYSYTPDGCLQTASSQLGHTVGYEYDDDERLSKVTSPNGDVVFEATYDDYNRVIIESNGLEHSIKTYSLADRFSRDSSVHGEGIHYFDERFRLVKEINALGGAISYRYGSGEEPLPEEIVDPLGNATHVTYDAMGNVTEVIDASGAKNSYWYDVNGNLLAALQSNGLAQIHCYDEKNRKTKTYHHVALELHQGVWSGNSVGDLTNVTLYEYIDDSGLLSKVTNPEGGSREFFYDTEGNLTEIRSPSGYRYLQFYDERGRVAMTKQGANVILHHYDLSDRLIAIVTGTGNVSFDYDANGNMTRFTDKRGYSTSFEYNSLNGLIKVVDAEDGITEYIHDHLGNLIKIILPSRYEKAIVYDTLNRPVQESWCR